MHFIGLMANEFHNISLSAGRPTHLAKVCAEHPKCRPNALAFREFGPYVDSPVLEFALALRGNPRRSIVGAAEGLLAGRNNHAAVFKANVARATAVELKLVVAPTAVAGFVVPGLGI